MPHAHSCSSSSSHVISTHFILFHFNSFHISHLIHAISCWCSFSFPWVSHDTLIDKFEFHSCQFHEKQMMFHVLLITHPSFLTFFSHKTIGRLSSLAHWLHQCWYHLSPCAPTIVNQSFLYCFACISCNPMKHIIVLIAASAWFFYLMPSGPDNLDAVQISSRPFLGWAGMKGYDMKSSSFALLTHLMIWSSPKIPKIWNLKKCFLLIKFFKKINGLRSSQRVPL